MHQTKSRSYLEASGLIQGKPMTARKDGQNILMTRSDHIPPQESEKCLMADKILNAIADRASWIYVEGPSKFRDEKHVLNLIVKLARDYRSKS